MSETLLLIDLSALAHQIWHSDTANPDPSRVSTQIVARVRALASAHPFAAICCDSGKSWRADVDPSYKAQRDTENRAPLRHQMVLACETLQRDGFPVWAAPGAEADDIIATAVRLTREQVPETDVLIVTADKDLLQLVNERVSVKNLMTGNIAGPAEVFDKFGVKPEQMTDLLCLMGDASDNIKGAEKIGKVIAARLLSEHGTLDALYAKMAKGMVAGVTPAMRTNLMEFATRRATVRKLVALKDDIEIPFHEISVERTAVPMVEEPEMSEDTPEYDDLPPFAEQLSNALKAGHGTMSESAKAAVMEAAAPLGRKLDQNESLSALGGATAKVAERINAAEKQGQPPLQQATAPSPSQPSPSLVPRHAEVLDPAPPEWELKLQPRTYAQLRVFAADAFQSRKYMRNFESAEAAIMAVMSGRELGVPAMASLRGFHSIEGGPPMPNADLVRSIVLKSGKVEYFEPTERSATAAEFVIKRIGRPEVKLRYTIEEGRTAYGFDVPMSDKAREELTMKWQKSSWGKNSADMCVARASMKLGRLVCPDVCAGLYAKEEFD